MRARPAVPRSMRCSAPGPGVLNTGAALAYAWGVNAPVLCLTGQVQSMMIGGRGRGQLHELPDQLATLRSLLKWVETHRASEPGLAPHRAGLPGRCCQAAPGPVALEMPWSQFTASAEITPQDPLPLHPKPQPDPERIAALATKLLLGGARKGADAVGRWRSPATPQRRSAPWPSASTPQSSPSAAAAASSTTATRSA